MRHQHNAHSSDLVVRYRYHPWFGRSVELVRQFDPDHLLVRVRDNVQFIIPLWMFDAAHCAGLQDAEHPLLAIDALRSLRSLIDAQESPKPAAMSAVANAAKKGARHGPGVDSTAGSSAAVSIRRG